MISSNTRRMTLNPELRSPSVQTLEVGLHKRIVGQDRALRAVAASYQIFQAGLSNDSRPLAVLLFLGPTGSGKTRVVEALAEILFNDPRAVIKIDCAEFQHSHEIAKLIGSPPGYLGHRETLPLLNERNLAMHRTEENPFTLILFDEIEKASDSLWNLLLGILDKATLTLGDNQCVDFSHTMIFMTSNLGASEMSRLFTGSLGFASPNSKAMVADDLDQKIYKTALDAARRKFAPEFMNRIDKVVVFRSLREEHLKEILDLELSAVQRTVDASGRTQFTFTLSNTAKHFLLAKGIDRRYGARHLKRVMERYLVFPLCSLISTQQLHDGDEVLVDVNQDERDLCFSLNEPLRQIAAVDGHRLSDFESNAPGMAA